MHGERIKELRKEKNLTQSDLAKILNVTQDSISLWEKNKRLPDTPYIVLLAMYFGVSSDYLLGLEDETGAKAYNNTVNDNHGHITFNQK